MKEIKMRGVHAPTNIEKIRKFETLIKAKLPDDYIEWLLKYNGGHPVFDIYDFIEPISESETGGDIAWFTPLGREYKINLEYKYEVFLNRIPNEMIVIANEGCGNSICLGVREPYFGKVYYWDHEFEAGAIKYLYENFGLEIAMKNTGLSAEEIIDYGDEPSYKNIYLIANSFTEFINKLKPYKENE